MCIEQDAIGNVFSVEPETACTCHDCSGSCWNWRAWTIRAMRCWNSNAAATEATSRARLHPPHTSPAMPPTPNRLWVLSLRAPRSTPVTDLTKHGGICLDRWPRFRDPAAYSQCVHKELHHDLGSRKRARTNSDTFASDQIRAEPNVLRKRRMLAETLRPLHTPPNHGKQERLAVGRQTPPHKQPWSIGSASTSNTTPSPARHDIRRDYERAPPPPPPNRPRYLSKSCGYSQALVLRRLHTQGSVLAVQQTSKAESVSWCTRRS